MKVSRRELSLLFGVSVLTLTFAVVAPSLLDVNALDRQLVRAVVNEDEQNVLRLLKRGACPDTTSSILRESNGAWERILVTLRLRAPSADPTLMELRRKTINSDSPVVIIAAQLTSRRILQHLLEKGANPNVRNSSGRTALMQCVFVPDPMIMRSLLESGADTFAEDNAGNTAYELALHNKSEQWIMALLRPKQSRHE